MAREVADDFEAGAAEWQGDQRENAEGDAKREQHEDWVGAFSRSLTTGEAGDDDAKNEQTHACGTDAAAEEMVGRAAMVVERVEKLAETEGGFRGGIDVIFGVQAFASSLWSCPSASKERA